MIHTGPVSGEFTGKAKPSKKPCPKCNGALHYITWESSCGGYEDYQYECDDCGYTFWVEGPDS